MIASNAKKSHINVLQIKEGQSHGGQCSIICGRQFSNTYTDLHLRFLEHSILPQRRAPHWTKPTFDDDSSSQEGVEGFIPIQGWRIWRFGPSPASYHRRERFWQWSRIRWPDSCYLDPPLQRVSHIFSCGGEVEFKVCKGVTFNWGMDCNQGISRNGGKWYDLLNHDWRKESFFHHELESIWFWECSSFCLKQLVFSSRRVHQIPPNREQEWG